MGLVVRFLASILFLVIPLKAGMWAESRWGTAWAVLYFLATFAAGLHAHVLLSRSVEFSTEE